MQILIIIVNLRILYRSKARNILRMARKKTTIEPKIHSDDIFLRVSATYFHSTLTSSTLITFRKKIHHGSTIVHPNFSQVKIKKKKGKNPRGSRPRMGNTRGTFVRHFRSCRPIVFPSIPGRKARL